MKATNGNRLYYGDCLTIMQEFGLASVDLIYLDPPFNSNRQYNAIYKDETGRPLPDQIEQGQPWWWPAPRAFDHDVAQGPAAQGGLGQVAILLLGPNPNPPKDGVGSAS